MIEQVPTSIKISGPDGIIESVVPTAVSEQLSNTGVHEVHIEWSTVTGDVTGTVLTTPLHLTETLDKGGFFEPASMYKHYANQPKFNPEGGYSAYNQTYNQTHPQPKADLSQIAADLAKLPVPVQPKTKAKKKPSPKFKNDVSSALMSISNVMADSIPDEEQQKFSQFAATGEIWMDKHGKSIPIGKVLSTQMTPDGIEIEVAPTDGGSVIPSSMEEAISNVWGVPLDMVTLEGLGPMTPSEVAEHVMRVAAKQAAETLYHGLANAKDFLPVGNTLNGVQDVELGGHKYDILLTIKHKEVKP